MLGKEGRFYDAEAVLTGMVVIGLDQWTKSVVIRKIAVGAQVPLGVVGNYVVLDHIDNRGVAFSMLSKGGSVLFVTVLIVVAMVVVGYLYGKARDTGSLVSKLLFGGILGGACSNLIDRVLHSGYVVDFISFRIPEVGFYFAIFNIADACISVGVVGLFCIFLLGSGFDRRKGDEYGGDASKEPKAEASSVEGESLSRREGDV